MEKTRKENRGKQLWDVYRVPFLSAFLFGLLAYGFLLANKIPVDDDLPFFFGKGATTISGRWGLALLRFVMPDLSLPWFYGLLSLLFLSLAACLIVGIFRLKHPALQIVLCGLFVCFPAETGTISYTFTRPFSGGSGGAISRPRRCCCFPAPSIRATLPSRRASVSSC